MPLRLRFRLLHLRLGRYRRLWGWRRRWRPNRNQIELINLIIENIVKYGAYSKNEIPKLSNDILGKSIFNIFTDNNDLQKIVDIVDKINSNAPKLL